MLFRSAVKRAISTYAPALFSAIRYGRSMAHRRRNVRLQSRLTPWKEAFVRKFGNVVQGGPFAGIADVFTGVDGTRIPSLLASGGMAYYSFLLRKPPVAQPAAAYAAG